MNMKKLFNPISMLVVILLATMQSVNAVPVGVSYAYQALTTPGSSASGGLPPVIGTNTTLTFTSVQTIFTTNADGSVYTNTIVPTIIDATAERFVGIDVLTQSGIVNGTAGNSNLVIQLAPIIIGSTNYIKLLNASLNAYSSVINSSNAIINQAFDTNHLITLTVPLNAVAGTTSDWTTNLDGAGLQGWWVYSIQNQVKNGLVTNQISYSAKSGAP